MTLTNYNGWLLRLINLKYHDKFFVQYPSVYEYLLLKTAINHLLFSKQIINFTDLLMV